MLQLNLRIRKFFITMYKKFWSCIFRLVFGREWFAKHKEYDKLVWVRHLFEILLSGYVRRVGNLAQIKLPNGMIVLLPFGVDMGIIVREIFIDEVYDRFYKPRDNDIVIDVGAHVGLFSLKVCRSVKRVIAIEPHPFNYKLLLTNLRLNRIENVTPMKLAISNYSGTAKLYLGKESSDHTIKPLSKMSHSSSIDVECDTLDNCCKTLSKVNFIKIDVEGAELDVLKGSERILTDNDLFLAIAAYHYPKEIIEIAKFLQARGMKVFSDGAYIYAFKRKRHK